MESGKNYPFPMGWALGKSTSCSPISTSVGRPRISNNTRTRSRAGTSLVTTPSPPLNIPEMTFILAPTSMGFIGDFENSVGGDQAKFDHDLRRNMNRNALSPYHVSNSASIMNITQMLDWVEPGEEISGKKRFKGLRFNFLCSLGAR